MTSLDLPVLGVATAVHITDSLDVDEMVHHFSVLELPDTLDEAVAAAVDMSLALNPPLSGGPNPGGDPGGSKGGIGIMPPDPTFNPPDHPIETPGDEPCIIEQMGQEIPEECCACYTADDSCRIGCKWLRRGAIAGCLGAGFAGYQLGVVSACVSRCMVGGALIGPLGLKTCATFCIGSAVVAFLSCLYTAHAAYRHCLASCDSSLYSCLNRPACVHLIP